MSIVFGELVRDGTFQLDYSPTISGWCYYISPLFFSAALVFTVTVPFPQQFFYGSVGIGQEVLNSI